MKKSICLTILIVASLLLGCAVQEQPVSKEDVVCDASKPCSEGYQCVKLPDKTSPTCVTEDTLQSPEYKDCAVAESYPIQLICPQINARGGCESDSDCKISGCNGEVCSEQEGVASICVYKPEFECYTLTNCKCTNGKCGWEQTEEFLNCIVTKK